MTKSYGQLNFLSNNISIILRVQFQVFSGVTLELIKLCQLINQVLFELKIMGP